MFYEELPLLSPEVILDQCGFATFETSEDFFIQCIGQALKKPAWLAFTLYTKKHEEREEKDLPRAKYMHCQDLLFIKELARSADLTDTARKVSKSKFVYPGNAMAEVDVIVRALEIMSEHYPNLTMFRGTSFDNSIFYTGYDFAPGDLRQPLRTAKGSYAGPRRNPVVVMISFKQVVEEYCRGRLGMRTESPWWCNSLEISPRNRGIARVYRLPTSQYEVDEILCTYEETTIKL